MRGVASSFEGMLTSVSPEAVAITLLDGSSFTFQPAQLERSEVRARRGNTLLGAVVGSGAGLGVGVALVVTSRGSDAGGDSAFGDEFEPWKLIVPAAAGALVGSVVGYTIRTPRWVPGFVPGGASPGDLALAWSLPVGT